MFLLKLGSELQNLVKKLQCAMKTWTNYRLHFHEVECTGVFIVIVLTEW